MISCRNCGSDYDPETEVACPICTSGMAHQAVAGLPKVDARKASQTRAAVEAAEKRMFLERSMQAKDVSRRRKQRVTGLFQMAFGFSIAGAGMIYSGRLGEIPVYGEVMRFAPLAVGGGFALLGLVRIFKDG